MHYKSGRNAETSDRMAAQMDRGGLIPCVEPAAAGMKVYL